jgi:hypothetical protein
MIPIYIGWDKRESVAWHVLAQSITKHSKAPVSFCPVGNDTLPPDVWWRKRGANDSTDFSNARFAVPFLQGYRGWAVFADCDMVCLADIVELWAQRDDRYAVQVVKHRYRPKERTKFLGARQAAYARKNWSSLMLLNCGHPATQRLTPDYINTACGLDLHGFAWCEDSDIGDITGLWNVLLAPDPQHPEPVDRYDLKLLHYTLGGPWHGYHVDSHPWRHALDDLLAGVNPCASLSVYEDGPGTLRFVGQFQERFSHETP